MKIFDITTFSDNELITEADQLCCGTRLYRLSDVIRMNAVCEELQKRGFLIEQGRLIQQVSGGTPYAGQ